MQMAQTPIGRHGLGWQLEPKGLLPGFQHECPAREMGETFLKITGRICPAESRYFLALWSFEILDD